MRSLWKIGGLGGAGRVEVVDDDGTPEVQINGVRVLSEQVTAIADLDQTISDPPTQAEVQAISDKVDAILAALRAHGQIAT